MLETPSYSPLTPVVSHLNADAGIFTPTLSSHVVQPHNEALKTDSEETVLRPRKGGNGFLHTEVVEEEEQNGRVHVQDETEVSSREGSSLVD